MNAKGQSIFFLFMLGAVLFVLGIALATPLRQTIAEALGSGLVGCSTATDFQTKSFCTSLDMMTPLFVGLVLGLAGVAVGNIAN